MSLCASFLQQAERTLYLVTEHFEEAASVEWLDRPFDPKTADAWDRVNCGEHGFLKHVLVHEAGHAVAAARLDIDFVDVAVMPPGNRTKMGDGLLGGGLRLSRFENGWAADRIDEAFEMCLMGAVAEKKILQHELKGGFLQDVEQFKRAGNYLDGVPQAVFQPLHSRVMAKIDEKWSQIERDIRVVVGAFAKQFTASDAQLVPYLTEPLVLTSSEVRSILGVEDFKLPKAPQ